MLLQEAFHTHPFGGLGLKQFKDLVDTSSEVSEDNSQVVLRRIERIGKGRFAQRLADKVANEPCPAYIEAAFQHIVGQLGP